MAEKRLPNDLTRINVQSRNNEELSQRAAGDFMASAAYDRHLRKLRAALADQRARMAAAIADHFPAGTRFNQPDGGLALWVELPDKRSSTQLFNAALAEGILIAPGAMFSNAGRFEHFIRLNCGWPYNEQIESAVQRLGQLCANIGAAR